MLILHVDYGHCDPCKEIIVYALIMRNSVIVQMFAH